MASRRRDDRWQRYPESVPLPRTAGSRRRSGTGAMAASWWSQRFVDVLESYGLGYSHAARAAVSPAGQVLSFDVQAGMLVAQVQGSRPTPYVVTVAAAQPTVEQWASVDGALAYACRVRRSSARGRGAERLEDVFRDASVDLFPVSWSSLDAALWLSGLGEPVQAHRGRAVPVR